MFVMVKLDKYIFINEVLKYGVKNFLEWKCLFVTEAF